MRRRDVPAVFLAWLVPGIATSAIVKPLPASAELRHRLSDAQVFALACRELGMSKSDAVLLADFARLLGSRHADFIAGLTDQVAMHRVGDAILGEGTRPGTMSYEASFFVLGPRGAMFAVVKGGRFGADIAEFGDVGLLADWTVRHRYLEFTDLDE